MNKHLKSRWLAASIIGCALQSVLRVAMVVGIRKDKIADYKQLHAGLKPACQICF